MEIDYQEFNRRIASIGGWVATEQLRVEGKVDKDRAHKVYHKLFKYALGLAQEAQKEVRNTGASVQRLETICQRGSKFWSGRVMSAEYDALNEELLTFLGWTVSLVETVISLQGLIQPKAVPVRINQLASALQALHGRRQASTGLLNSGADLFKSLTEPV